MKNRRYENHRNALIASAEKHANGVAGEFASQRVANGQSVSGWASKWNRAFHTRMTELARGVGLVQPEATE